MGFWLKSIIASTIATRTFNRACRTSTTATIARPSAISTVSCGQPQDARAGKAKVLRAFANVRQYVTAEGGTWSSALEAADEMVEQVGQLPEFRDEQVNLAELIIKIGEGLADRARQGADAKALAEAESVVGLHAQVAGEPAPAFLESVAAAGQAGRGPGRRAQGAGPRSRRSRAMDQAIKDGAAARVYDARDALVEQYADLAHDKDADRADDRRQRADPQGGHGRPDAPAGRAIEPPGAARAADQPGAPHRQDATRSTHRRPKRSSLRWPTGLPTRSTV